MEDKYLEDDDIQDHQAHGIRQTTDRQSQVGTLRRLQKHAHLSHSTWTRVCSERAQPRVRRAARRDRLPLRPLSAAMSNLEVWFWSVCLVCGVLWIVLRVVWPGI